MSVRKRKQFIITRICRVTHAHYVTTLANGTHDIRKTTRTTVRDTHESTRLYVRTVR
jgi:hypothetical protein